MSLLGRLRSWINTWRYRRQNEHIRKLESVISFARAYIRDSKKAHSHIHERVWYLIVFASKMVDLGVASWFSRYNPRLRVRKGSGNDDVCIRYDKLVVCGSSTWHYNAYYHDQWIPSTAFNEEPWNGIIDEFLDICIRTTETMLSDLVVERNRLVQQMIERVENEELERRLREDR